MKQIMALLRDSIWQFIWGLVGTLLVLFGMYASTAKEIQVSVMLNSPLVYVIDKDMHESVKIVYGESELKNPYLIMLRLENTGAEVINEGDYARRVSLSFPEDTRILEASVYGSYPSNIGITLEVIKNKIFLSKILFQPGENVGIRIIVDSDKNYQTEDYPFSVDARIVGVYSVPIVNREQEVLYPVWTNIVGPVTILLGILLLIGTIVYIILRVFRVFRVENSQREN